MGQITYTDKSNNRTLPTISADQKVSAADMNEIKTEHNATDLIVQANQTKLDTITDVGSGQIITSGERTQISTNTAAIALLDFTPETGLSFPITFGSLKESRWGDPNTPLSGTITYDAITPTPVDGAWSVLYYSDSTDPFETLPTIPDHEVVYNDIKTFESGFVMKYTFKYLVISGSDNQIEITAERKQPSAPTASGVSLDDGANATVGTQLTVLYTYVPQLPETLAEDSSILEFQVYRGDTPGSLATITDGTQVHSTSDGTVTWTPQATEEAKYIKGRIRVAATGGYLSDWYETAEYGPVAAGFSPAALSSVLLWYDFTQSSTMTAGTNPDKPSIIVNQSSIASPEDLDYVQGVESNQASGLSTVDTNGYITLGTNSRYRAGSWSYVGDLIAAGAVRSWYMIIEPGDGVSGDIRIAYLGGNVWMDTDTGNYIKVQSGGLVTPNDSIASPPNWMAIRFEYDGADSKVDILKGKGAGSGTASQSTAGALGLKVSATNFECDIYVDSPHSAIKIKHFILVDGTISGGDKTTLETWITDNTPDP